MTTSSGKEVEKGDDGPKAQLPPHLELQRTRIVCKADAPIHTEAIDYSGAYVAMGVDHSVPFGKFCKDFRVKIKKLTEDEMEFDMIGIDASIANAFRRILLSEVPTMAIEKVLMVNNTSEIPDEVLSHRLGLIPLDVDPRLFEFISESDAPNERNTIVYKLNVSCGRGSGRIKVLSGDLKWLPEGSELEMSAANQQGERRTYTSFGGNQKALSAKPLAVKEKKIVIAKLGAGQEIELEAHAVKGIGSTHAKWSPVATAWYRMLPEVVLLKEVKDAAADALVKMCPRNVFDIEELGNAGERRAVVSRPRDCSLCRECIRGLGEEQVELQRVRDHFIFTVQSTGALPPEILVTEAVKILEEKCLRVITELS